jgi:hypothetical protein
VFLLLLMLLYASRLLPSAGSPAVYHMPDFHLVICALWPTLCSLFGSCSPNVPALRY